MELLERNCIHCIQHVSRFGQPFHDRLPRLPGPERSGDALFCAYALEVVGKACHL